MQVVAKRVALEIQAERCVHQRVTSATCRACVDACPQLAWTMHDTGLGFDASACSGCGLCVAVCPQDALQLPLPAPVVGAVALAQAGQSPAPITPQHAQAQPGWVAAPVSPQTSGRTLLLACAHLGDANCQPTSMASTASDADVGAPGIVPCLYALSAGWLRSAMGEDPVAQIVYAHGDCARCVNAVSPGRPDGWRHHWSHDWARLDTRLQHLGCAATVLRRVSAAEWRAARAQALAPAPAATVPPGAAANAAGAGAAPNFSLRRLFAPRVLPARHPVEPLAQSGKPAAPTAALTPGNAAAPRRPVLRGARVEAVDALRQARSAATGAPVPASGAEALAPLWAVRLDATRCTWCMACTQVCGPQALRRLAEPGGARALFVLDMTRCTGCGLCQAVCAPGALSPVSDSGALTAVSDSCALSNPQRLPLLQRQCPQCRVHYHRPAGVPVAPGETCPTCAQGRPHRSDRIVQL